MKYYIGFSKVDDSLKVIVHGMNPENENGLVSRSSSVDLEEVFDDFQQYSTRLLESGIGITEPGLSEEPTAQETVIDVLATSYEPSDEATGEAYVETIEHIEPLETI